MFALLRFCRASPIGFRGHMPEQAVRSGSQTICLQLTTKEYVDYVSNALRAAQFRQVSQDVEATLRSQNDSGNGVCFVTSCIEEIVLAPENSVALSPHARLTLNVFVGQAESLLRSSSDASTARARIAQLVTACCLRIQHLLATSEAAAAKQCASVTLRLVTAYSLQQNDMPGSHLHELLVSLLGPLQALKQAADLLVLFPQLLGDIDFQNFFAQLAAEKLFSSGEHIAGQGSASIKVAWVQELLSSGCFKPAVSAVRKWNLQPEFPDLEHQWQQSAFASRRAAADWGSAGLLALENRDMQVALIQDLADARELTLATDFCFQFGLQPQLFPGLPHPLPAEVQAVEGLRFLPLPLPSEAIVLVDSAAKLHMAQQALMAAEAVGMDVECAAPRLQIAEGRSTHLGIKEPMQPALLQVATPDQVFIFDLLAMQASATDRTASAASAGQVLSAGVTLAAVDACLAPVLGRASPSKLGCGLVLDFRDLARAMPSAKAFQGVQGIVDLRQLWCQHAPQAAEWLAAHSTHRGPNMSLTAMAESVLGKPLNKAMQCSNWAARPLSPMQMSYAALDAHVCLQILHAIRTAAGKSLAELQCLSSAPPSKNRKITK